MRHCVKTIQAIVSENRSDRRSILQLGYNLGRLSELSGLGRGPFWDRWKRAVSVWDVESLSKLAHELPKFLDDAQADDETNSEPPLNEPG